MHYAAALHDITTGNNDVAEIGGFDAGVRQFRRTQGEPVDLQVAKSTVFVELKAGK
ncbi:MAG TPA: hypothetical protein VF506_17865 [Streptosporangiaceae bacterium]